MELVCLLVTTIKRGKTELNILRYRIIADPFFKMFLRKLESPYTHCSHIHEFFNTISNLFFIVIGIIRLCDQQIYDNPHMFNLYVLYTMAGFCSGFHHMKNYRLTIVIDWIPIGCSILYLTNNLFLLSHISLVSYIKLFTALFVLATDHIFHRINTPWGHVFWHILASFSIDSAYMDIIQITKQTNRAIVF